MLRFCLLRGSTMLLRHGWWLLCWSGLCLPVWATSADNSSPTPVFIATRFAQEVRRQIQLPAAEQTAYATRLQQALNAAGTTVIGSQFVLLVDRHPLVQTAFLYWGSPQQGWFWIGASPVSTGLPGQKAYFATPLGVFDHSLAHPDFRAEGTKNERGFRGYGRKGLRVYDLGWVDAPRTWDKKGGMGTMRLQMHSTDPDAAEPLLGSPRSAGCVRIASTFNDFIDRYALLDADYERAVAQGQRLWVLRPDRTPTATPGRYIVVVDSQVRERPVWARKPGRH